MSAQPEARINLLDLPTEILDIILDDLYYLDLLKCCLVSRAFLPLARKFLFDVVDLLKLDSTSKPMVLSQRLNDRGTGSFLRRQSRTVAFVDQRECLSSCITAGTRVIRLDLSSHATPLDWTIERLSTLFLDVESKIQEVDLLLPGTRISIVLAMLLEAPNVRDITLWRSRDDELGRAVQCIRGPALLFVDCHTDECTLFMGDYPFYRPARYPYQHSKVVSIAEYDKGNGSLDSFLQWITAVWPTQPVTAPTVNIFRQLMIRSYPFDLPSGRLPNSVGDEEAEFEARAEFIRNGDYVHHSNARQLCYLGYELRIPLEVLNFYGFGRDWLSLVATLAEDGHWLPNTNIHLWLDCTCEGTGLPQAVCEVTGIDWLGEDDDDDLPAMAWQARQEHWTCEALRARLQQSVSTVRKQRLVVEHVIDGEDCFIGIRFLQPEDEGGSIMQRKKATEQAPVNCTQKEKAMEERELHRGHWGKSTQTMPLARGPRARSLYNSCYMLSDRNTIHNALLLPTTNGTFSLVRLLHPPSLINP